MGAKNDKRDKREAGEAIPLDTHPGSKRERIELVLL